MASNDHVFFASLGLIAPLFITFLRIFCRCWPNRQSCFSKGVRDHKSLLFSVLMIFVNFPSILINQNPKKQRNSPADHWTWPLDRNTLQRRRKRLRHRNSFHPDTKMGASCCAVQGCQGDTLPWFGGFPIAMFD